MSTYHPPSGLPDVKLRENSYLIFKEGSTYYSQSSAGVVNSNAAFSTVFQAIIDSISSFDSTTFTKIKVGPGAFDINTVVTIADKYNIHVQGAGEGLTIIQQGPSLGASARMIDIKGSVSGTGKNLTVNGTKKSFTVTMSTSDSATFAEGDWVLVRSTKGFVPAISTTNKQGEIKQIDAVDTGTGIITFTTPLFDTYNTADTANVIKLLQSQNIVFSDLTISQNSSYTGTGRQFVEEFVNGFRLNNMSFVDPPGDFDSCCVINSCINGRINSCHLIMHETEPTNEQYGIAIQNCSQNITVSNSTSRGRFRHPFEAGNNKAGTNQEGPCRAILFDGCSGSDSHEAVFDTHHMGEGIQFSTCHVLGKRLSYGIQTRSIYTKINNCFINGCKLDGINLEENAHDCEVSDTTIIDCGVAGIRVDDGVDRLRINTSVIKGNSANGINTPVGGCDNMIITGNVISDNTDDGLNISDADDCIFSDNIIKDNGAWGIDFTPGDCKNNVISDNIITGNTSGQIRNGNQLGNKLVREAGISNPYTDTNATLVRTGMFTAATTTNAQGLLSTGITAIGTATMITSNATEGLYPDYATGAVANNNAGLRWTAAAFSREWGFYMILRVIPSSTSDIRCFIGLSSDAAEIAGETTLDNFSGVGVGKRAGDTNWFTYRNDGDATEDRVDTGIPFAASGVTIEMTLNPTEFRCGIGGVEQTAQTTELPAAGTDLFLHVEIETGAGGATKTIGILPIYVRNGV